MCLIYFLHPKDQSLYVPVHLNPSLFNLNPLWHEHSNEPSLLWQVCWHLSFFSVHSLISRKEKWINYITFVRPKNTGTLPKDWQNSLKFCFCSLASADLEVQLVQLNHCDGVYSNYWNTLLRNLKLSPYINFELSITECEIKY